MRGRILCLREVERILAYLDGELRCRHAILGEAIAQVSEKTGHPFRSWLLNISTGIELQLNQSLGGDQLKDFYHIWSDSLIFLRDNTLLLSKDIDKLYDVGKALGYLDIESQQMNLDMERDILHRHILDLDKDIASRMKNAIVMCFLGGIMTVIALL